MKSELILGTMAFLLAGSLSAEKLPDDFRYRFEQKFRKGRTYAVVVKPGVPTTSVYGVKGDQTDAHYSVDIIDGSWKTSEGLLDFNQTPVDFLDRGEVMELADISYKDNRVDLRFVSLEAKRVTRGNWLLKSEKREPVATNFKFFFPVPKYTVITSADIPMVMDYIGGYLSIFPDQGSARAYGARLVTAGADSAPGPAGGRPSATVKKEIKVGMTSLDVIDILGRPQKEMTFGNTTRWTYPDLTVIFENGKVREVKF